MLPALRFPAFDRGMGRWFDWKRRANEEHGFQISGHYVSLYQSLSDLEAHRRAAHRAGSDPLTPRCASVRHRGDLPLSAGSCGREPVESGCGHDALRLE